MSQDLLNAHHQWASRPRDERFHSLEDLFTHCSKRRNATWQANTPFDDVNPVPVWVDGHKALGFETGGRTVAPSNWSFGQYARMVGAPPSYLATLTPDLAVRCLEENRDRRMGSVGMVNTMGSDEELDETHVVPRMRALTSPSYGRIWDADVVQCVRRIVEMSDGKFQPPKAYRTDERGFAGINGETETSGLFASDRDVFMFLIDGGSFLDGGGKSDQLNRGFIVTNSEVGSAALTILTCLFRGVCGNLIIWGAQDVSIARIRHSTRAGIRFDQEAYPALMEFATATAAPTEALVAQAKAKRLDWVASVDNVVENQRAFMKRFALTMAEFKGGMQSALQHEGQCDSVWDMVQGLTRYSQSLAFTDARIDLDRRAGKILELIA